MRLYYDSFFLQTWDRSVLKTSELKETNSVLFQTLVKVQFGANTALVRSVLAEPGNSDSTHAISSRSLADTRSQNPDATAGIGDDSEPSSFALLKIKN